jgi:hypothetical protein
MMRQSHTAVVERNITWRGPFTVEPYEVAWASEALYFVRVLAATGMREGVAGRVQISPDGMNWCDEGTLLPLPTAPGMTFCRVQQFGGWLRVVGELPADATLQVIVYLTLKE